MTTHKTIGSHTLCFCFWISLSTQSGTTFFQSPLLISHTFWHFVRSVSVYSSESWRSLHCYYSEWSHPVYWLPSFRFRPESLCLPFSAILSFPAMQSPKYCEIWFWSKSISWRCIYPSPIVLEKCSTAEFIAINQWAKVQFIIHYFFESSPISSSVDEIINRGHARDGFIDLWKVLTMACVELRYIATSNFNALSQSQVYGASFWFASIGWINEPAKNIAIFPELCQWQCLAV